MEGDLLKCVQNLRMKIGKRETQLESQARMARQYTKYLRQRMWVRFFWLGVDPSGKLPHTPSGSIKCGQLLEYQRPSVCH
jgi:hypothetical protein